MAKKPSWKSREVVEPYVEKQGTNRKLHTIRKQGPAREAPDLKLGFKTKNGFEYGQTANLVMWIRAQKSGVPTDGTGNHTIQHTTGSADHNGIQGADGSLLTTKDDTPFVRFTPKPYRSLTRAIVFNSGSGDRHFLHVTSSQYTTLANGTAGTKNKSMTWNVWIKPRLTGTHAGNTRRYIFRKQSGSAAATNREYSLSIDPDAKLVFQLWDESTSKHVLKTTDLRISGSGIQTGVWQNICVTYSGKTGSYTHQGIKMYRNGILVSSGNAGTTQSGYVATENAGGDLVIGTAFTGSTTANNFFAGKMAEFSMWHTALTEKEVKALYDARKFFGRMDTTAIDHLRQGVSILSSKQRWRSSNAPKISGISRLSTDDVISHEQDKNIYGDAKLFRDDTPFEELADAERLRKDISRTVVGSKASASLEFRGYQPIKSGSSMANGLILTGANGTKSVFYFERKGQLSSANTTAFKASGFHAVTVTAASLALATGNIGRGELWAAAFTSAVNGQTNSNQIVARRVGNVVKLTSTVTGTAGNTYISPRILRAATTSVTGVATLFENRKNDASIYPSAFSFITGTFNTASVGATPGRDGVLTFRGGNSTMKHVVTRALGGAIDYMQDNGHQQYPVIITNVSMRDPAQFDGNIEPLPIRTKVSWASPEAPFLARDVRASFMGGEGSVLFGSTIIEQKYDNKNPAKQVSTPLSAPHGARRDDKVTDPFIDAQENIFGLGAKPAYAYLRFNKVPHNRDKIILTDTKGKAVCFEFVNSTSRSTGTFGKLRNRPSSSGTGRGTWRVLLTSSAGAGLTTGSQTKSQVTRAMHLFRMELHHAYNLGRLAISGSDRAYKETAFDADGKPINDPSTNRPRVVTYPNSGSNRSNTYVRLDQKASGSDGNRRIDFRARGFSSGTYIVNNVTASEAYRSIVSQFSGATTYRNFRTRIKFVRQKAKKMGIAFVSGSDAFNLPVDGYISDIERKAEPFKDTLSQFTKYVMSSKASRVRIFVHNRSDFDARHGLKFADADGNIFSASIDSSKTIEQSTSTKIGYSNASTTAKLARAIYGSLHHAMTYGVTAASTGSASSGGNKLKIQLDYTHGTSAASRHLFLSQSTAGPAGNNTITLSLPNESYIRAYAGDTNVVSNRTTGFTEGAAEIGGPHAILTSTMRGTREWTDLSHGYKSSGAGFTYDNDVFGTDSIAFGGKKR